MVGGETLWITETLHIALLWMVYETEYIECKHFVSALKLNGLTLRNKASIYY